MLVTPHRFGDSRGFLSEVFHAGRLAAVGITGPFIQDNHSFSAMAGTVRGLHLQIAPSAQGKLVRVTRGAIWDVAVDVRHGSLTYGRYVSAKLSVANWQQLWVPTGFLHGFCTLEPDTEVLYKVTAEYDPDAERGVAWDDPFLAIPWPVDPAHAALSDKDRALPCLADCPIWFRL
ncbi:MAG: dTDP-4-dehydrorhamnose 3,5-epimerase [Acetobacteraceae bacterium]|nr:dTDP-4-dehydrorhamnose 3,5-epimerase [Acetobacteraceae bacterium]MSP30709.1 dTDP-4-dehydrorhamnose 3,5-epimerase [Acetobacteraceae bacterium]